MTVIALTTCHLIHLLVSFDLFLLCAMSCYIRKLLPRGSSILSGAPFTTSSSRPRLMGPPSQLVSRKIALRPVQGPRHYSRQPNDDDSGNKQEHQYERFLVGVFGALAASTFALYIIWNIRPSCVNQRRNKPIYDLLVGPVLMDMECRVKMEINREEIIALIKNKFIKPESSEDIWKFGVIIGPCGTGKTFSTRMACKKHHCGVLYTEINTGYLVKGFAEQTGVPIEPHGLFDFVAKHLYNKHVHYYKLESLHNKDEFGALREIIAIVARQAGEFKKKHNQIPCLFIDGADLLAKKFPSRFPELIDEAKIYANDGILRIVFVSQEGHIMRHFQSRSSYSRAAKIVEILDIDDEEGKKYLVRYGLSDKLSEEVVKYAGGRMIFLLDAIDLYNEYRYKKNADEAKKKGKKMKEGDEMKKEGGNITKEDEEKIFEAIKRHLQSKYTMMAYREVLLADQSSVKLLLTEMWSSGDQCIDINGLLEKIKGEKDRSPVRITVNSLVQANVFRYDSEGSLRYHNRIIQNYIEDNRHKLL